MDSPSSLEEAHVDDSEHRTLLKHRLRRRNKFFATEGVEREFAALHASTIVWLALASCPGYSACENPRFWKLVFSTLWADSQRRCIADDVRFFEHPDRPFPCVRLVERHGREQKAWNAFFHGTSSAREVRRVLRRLEPYITDFEWWRRVIPVEIVDERLFFLQWTPPKPRRPTPRRPSFRLVTVRMRSRTSLFDRYDFLTTSALRRLMSKQLDGTAVHISHWLMETTNAGPLMFFLAHDNSCRHGASRVHFQTVQPNRTQSGDHTALAAMCSALPHLRLVTELELMGTLAQPPLDAISAAWLGYALFHPASATESALTALSLSLPRGRSTAADALCHMATGNNLLVAMGVTTAVSSAYYDARLAAGTHVHAGDAYATSILTYTFPRAQTVTLCIASADDLAKESWVRVVVPGIGLGWVHRKHIGSVVARAPSIPILRRLELVVYRYPQPVNNGQQTVVPQVLSQLGASVTHLKILSRIPAQELQAVLQSCPNLQALRVYHDGECWSDPQVVPLTPPVPKLKVLELLLGGAFNPLVAPQLVDLTYLRVIDTARGPSSRHHQAQILQTLARYPRLSHVCWSSVHCHPRPWWEASGYLPWWKPRFPLMFGYDRRDWQSTSYGLLGEDIRGTLDHARAPLPLYARLAFLSIVSSSTIVSSLPQLTSDIVRLVFAFGSISVPRQLLVRYDSGNPSE